MFINWIYDILKSGRTCVSFNGDQGDYFSCKQGLRQRDPLSPLLFDLVADALNKILSRGQHGDLIFGIGNFNNTSKVLNLQFTDDTLIFLKAYYFMLENLKFLLLGFEIVSGLRINFDKE